MKPNSEVQKEEQIKWEQRRYELAKEAMLALIGNATYFRRNALYSLDPERAVQNAVRYADALIQALRNDNHDLDE